MPVSKRTVDMEDRIEELQDRLDEIEDEQEEVKQKAIAQQDEEGELPSELEDEWDELEAERVEKEGELDKFQETTEAWGGSEFTIEELTFGQLQAINDEMMEESFDVDVQRQSVEGTPKQGFYQIQTLREAIISQPAEAPTRKDDFGKDAPAPGDYPVAVGEWLFEKVNAFNTTGEAEMGNSSLKEAINSEN